MLPLPSRSALGIITFYFKVTPAWTSEGIGYTAPLFFYNDEKGCPLGRGVAGGQHGVGLRLSNGSLL